MDLAKLIRTIPDFPEAGIQYRDITTLLEDPAGLREAVMQLAAPYRDAPPDVVAGLDARGFIFGAAVAVELGTGFVPIRKLGKLPGDTVQREYKLEYGTATLELHRDTRASGRVLLIDDLIATGGTAGAAVELLREIGCEVVRAAFVVDLPDLGGADRLRALGIAVIALVGFAGE